MPYPILTLPYPFAKRLSQLLSPFELQNLQIATGRSKGLLKPIVFATNVDNANFNGDTSDYITVGPKKVVKINNHKVFCKSKYFFFISLSDAVFENYHFNNTHYAPNIVTFMKCKINTKFLEKFAAKFRVADLEELNIKDANEIDKSLKFSTIFNLFPFLNTLDIKFAYNGWVREVVDANLPTKLHMLLIEHDDLDELLSFDSDDIRRLHEQHSEIFVQMTYIVHGPTHESGEYFEKRIRETFGLPKSFSNDIDFFVYFANQTENSAPIYWCSVDDTRWEY